MTRSAFLRTPILILVLAMLLARPAAANRDCPIDPQAGKPAIERAVSLRQLQEELRRCQRDGSCPDSVLELHGLTRIEGYAIDHAQRDIVLFGAVEPGAPALHVADFLVALRNTAKRYLLRENGQLYYSHPGVSIDPDPNVLAHLDRIVRQVNGGSSLDLRDAAIDRWCETCELPQQVRVMGVPFDTHFAEVMVTADYLMKRVTNGTANLDLPGFDSLSEMVMEAVVAETLNGHGESSFASLTRFWFHPGVNTYLEDEDAVLIQRSDVILLDEQEHLTKSGRIEATGYVDPLARKYSCAFSRRYREIARVHPIYASLEGIFRWVALARILEAKRAFQEARLDPAFLLDRFEVARVPVPRQLPGIAEVRAFDHEERNGAMTRRISLRLPSCGGVSIRLDRDNMTFFRDFTGWLGRLTALVLASRPGPRTAHWNVRAG